MKGFASAQKALQISEMEMRELPGEAEENSVSLTRGVIDLPSRQINDFSQERKQKKIELMARPGRSPHHRNIRRHRLRPHNRHNPG